MASCDPDHHEGRDPNARSNKNGNADADADSDQNAHSDANRDADFGRDGHADADQGILRDTDRDKKSDSDSHALKMHDLLSRVRAWTAGDGAAALAALSAEAWGLLASLGDAAEAQVTAHEAQARVHETAAGRYRSIALYVKVVQEKRDNSPAEQDAAFEGLKAAIVEANAGAGALSFGATLDKLRLALTSTTGQQEN